MFGGEHLEILAVLQADTGLGTEEVDVHLLLADILRPGAVEGDHRPLSTNHAGHRVVHVIHAVVLGRSGPHILVRIACHILAQLAECLARHGHGPRIAAAVHHDVQVMHTPVDERAAAGDRFGGESTAQPRDGAMGAKADIHLVHLAQLARIDVVLDEVDAVVEAVDHADVERFSRFMLHLLHLQRLGIGAGGGLFAQHVLARAQTVDGDGRMHVVGCANGNGCHLVVSQDIVVVSHRRAAAVFLHRRLGPLRQNVAEILDFRLFVVHVGGDMRRVGNGAAADNRDFHAVSSFLIFSAERPAPCFSWKQNPGLRRDIPAVAGRTAPDPPAGATA